jgi:CubicO group peptidase (beta-lactamase class C family)
MGLLGELLARRAGTNYEQLVLERICNPLGMTDTRITLSSEMQGRFATGHDRELNPEKNLDFLSLAGAGALRSTANDFLKFLAATLHPGNDRLSKALEASQAVRTNTAGPSLKVAWGWCFKTLPDEIIFHGGETLGFHSYMGVNRKRDRAVVVFSNCSGLIDDIALHLLDPRNELNPAAKPIVLGESTLERYVGAYQMTPTLVITISREKNQLYFDVPLQSKVKIVALARDEFFCEECPGRFSFKTNASGSVTELIVREGGKDIRAMRK